MAIEMNLWESEHVPINEIHASSLFALINSTTNLMWSVDWNYNLIVSNEAFDNLMVHMTGTQLSPGQHILAEGFSTDQNRRYKEYYDRGLAGETFTITDMVTVPTETWSEVSFFPIRNNEEIVGVACYSHDVTLRRKAENELRNAHNRLMLHVENTPMGFVEWDCDGHILKWSVQAERIFGWSEQDIASRKADEKWELLAEDQKAIKEINESLLSGEKDRATLQNKATTKSGNVIWCQWYVSAIKSKEGKVTSILSQVLDITEQKTAEVRILHANRLYSFISQVNHLIVKATDESTLFDEVCRIAVTTGSFTVAWIGQINEDDRTISLSASYGLPAEDLPMFTKVKYDYAGLSGKALKNGTHAISAHIDNDAALLKWQPLAQKRGWKSAISFPVFLSGKTIATFNLISPEIDFFSTDEVALLREATSDISFALGVFEKERKRQQAEYRLTLSEQRLRQAQTVAKIGSWHVDYATGLSTWSDETCKIYGLPPGANAQTYSSWLSSVHPDDVLMVSQVMSDSTKTLGSFDIHYRIVRPDGDIRFLYSKAEYELDDKSDPVSMYGVVQDVTEQKKAEAERSLMVADIVQRVKDLEQFSYIVSHNLRAPVANIRGLAEILQMPAMEEKETQLLIGELGGCVKKLDDVIHDLNYILQIRSKEDMHKETVRFADLIADIMNDLDNQFRSESAVIKADFSEVEGMQTVKSFMHSIFLNIISNSIKYHRPGVPPCISVTTKKAGNKFQLLFKDNGLGIDMDKWAYQVFGLYKRFHSHVQGKGMGLFMVKTQVEALGGQVTVESKVDNGTSFTLEFELSN